MTYLPLARKYRPQSFADLVGQPHVTTTLTRALETKRLAQAYLFAGMRGVGKTSAARILAKCLNCDHGPTPTPCDRCASCTQIIQGTSLDVIEIDGASNRGIEEIRSLRETVPFAPISGPYRIYIIDEVHMLTTEAFNALLKTLEEPPAHVKFVFATTAAHKVPATVLSRCQRFEFRRIETGELVAALTRVARAEQIAVAEGALYAIARASDGSLRDAEVILEQLSSFVEGTIEEDDVTELLGAVERDVLFTWVQAILDRKAARALSILHRELDQGKEAPQLLAGLLRHVRNLLILRTAQEVPSRDERLTRLVDEPADRLQRLQEQAGRLTTQELLLLLQILTGAYELVRRSPLATTILELAVIKLATREEWQSLGEISRRLEQLAGSSTQDRTTPPSVRLTRSGLEQAASPAPASSPQAAAPMPTIEEVVARWPVFLERLSAQKISLAAYLADAKPLQQELGMLTVGLPGFALHQEVLNAPENRRLITQLLSESCQAAITVQYVTLPEPPLSTSGGSAASSAERQAPPPLVQDIVNLFNATLLDRPRPT